MKIINVLEWLDYEHGLLMQEEALKRVQTKEGEETVFLVEHHPVYTMGRQLDQSSLGVIDSLPLQVHETNRGGQATYHGPGQCVGYLILDLNLRQRDLHQHLRKIEDALIETSLEFGVQAQRKEGFTGVWVEDRKLASIGVGVKKWVTMHGFALNVEEQSLAPFQAITPCGIQGVEMTCLSKEVSVPISMQQVKQVLASYLKHKFEV